ncbi:MAG: T9SS type A sorting domain-containing protein [Bacteroidota bacterium]
MKTKFLQSVLLMALIISPLFFVNSLKAQTPGTLTFGVTLTSHNASYGLQHVSAVWIENASFGFVKTKYRFASGHTLNSHLPVWKTNSASNVTDATTGATLNSYTPISISWNGTNVSAAVVADQLYRVYVEFTWDDGTANHDTTSVTFLKGVNAVHLTPANKTNFTTMTLDWVPTYVGITENQDKETFSVSPNPINSESTINYSLNTLSDVTISLYDINGKLVKVIFDDNQASGNYSMPLSLNGKVKPGVYFLKMYTGKTQHTERILITE